MNCPRLRFSGSPVAAQAATAPAPAVPSPQAPALTTSPWVRNRTDAGEPADTIDVELGGTHDSGLLKRGIHTEVEHD